MITSYELVINNKLYIHDYIVLHEFNNLAVMLILASQRIESVIGVWAGRDISEHEIEPTKRGAAPTLVEW